MAMLVPRSSRRPQVLVISGELKLSPEWRIGSHSRELLKAKGSLHPDLEADLEDDEEEGL